MLFNLPKPLDVIVYYITFGITLDPHWKQKCSHTGTILTKTH